MKTVLYYTKAVLSGLAAGVTALIAANTNGHITALEWGAAIVAALVAGGVVGAVPNGPKPAAKK